MPTTASQLSTDVSTCVYKSKSPARARIYLAAYSLDPSLVSFTVRIRDSSRQFIPKGATSLLEAKAFYEISCLHWQSRFNDINEHARVKGLRLNCPFRHVVPRCDKLRRWPMPVVIEYDPWHG
eukprot:6187369-Pleurochrysis_carterae.AAC.5